jgi:pyruvate dehydrogenase E2 component (dihydrolipoamide acetyltransferase)
MTFEVKVPDIGDFSDVPVIEVFVKAGDVVNAEDPIATLESDKATMDVPSPRAGTIKEVRVKIGDKVSEGSPLVVMDDGAGASASPAAAAPAVQKPAEPAAAQPPPQASPASATASREAVGESQRVEVRVPDIGDFKDVPVIEVFVKPGDTVKAEDPLVTLESDKATMDVPAPSGGVVKSVRVKIGDKVSEGTPIATLEATGAAPPSPQPSSARGRGGEEPSPPPAAAVPPSTQPSPPSGRGSRETAAEGRAPDGAPTAAPVATIDIAAFKGAHASPSVRAFARELGVDLSRVNGTGPKNRILHDDVRNFVKQVMTAGAAAPAAAGAITGGGALNLLPWPQVDFAKFGPVEARPLSRIKKISGANLARNWVMIPHVTNHDDADITELEALRVQLNKENEKSGIRVTMLAFLIKASVAALQKFPDFNASLDGENLIYKRYFNIGFAADTPNGLVVPVIKNADQKGVLAIAKEMAELSAKAREGKLGPADMQGGCFSISSLGGIGGTYFTPIINAPEVAILGVCRSATRPVWDGKQFAPRLMLPLSLSWDHRVIDGASAARFLAYLGALLADLRRAML